MGKQLWLFFAIFSTSAPNKRLLSKLYIKYFAPNANSFVFIVYENTFGDGGLVVGNNNNEQFTN